jgi:hypothetical protein
MSLQRRHRPERRPRQQEPVAIPKKSDDDDGLLLDEAEQLAIVDELVAQVAVHHRHVRMIWRVICYLTAVLCLAAPALLMEVVMARHDDNDVKSSESSFRSMLWLHAILAALLHSLTPHAIVVETTTIEAATTNATTTTMTARRRPLSGRSRLYATGLILSLFLAALCIANIRYKSTTTTTTTMAGLPPPPSLSNNNTVLSTTMTIIFVRLHQAMAASNLFLTFVALYLAYNMEREVTALQNLHHAQYRFKSL